MMPGERRSGTVPPIRSLRGQFRGQNDSHDLQGAGDRDCQATSSSDAIAESWANATFIT